MKNNTSPISRKIEFLAAYGRKTAAEGVKWETALAVAGYTGGNIVKLRPKNTTPNGPPAAAAMLYAILYGWKTFPANLEDGEKKSYLSAKHAPGRRPWGMTDDPEQLQRNFLNPKWRNICGVGVPTGGVNGIFDIEADTLKAHGKDGLGSLKKLEAEHGKLPDTLMAESPSGSPHHILRHPGQGRRVISRALPGYPGVDIRGDGAMFVAPPSARGDGVYRWLNNLPIADAPDWLLKLVCEDAPSISSRAIENLKRYGDSVRGKTSLDKLTYMLMEVIPNTVEKGRDHWIKVGHALKHERPDDDGLQLWLEFSNKFDGVFSGDKEKFNTDEKAREEYVIETWNGLKPNRITGGSIYWLCDEADADWRNKYATRHGGVKLTDFYGYMPMHNYIFAPSCDSWPAASVDARIPAVVIGVDAKGKNIKIKASAWIDKNQPVEQATWFPGSPMIIADRLIDKGGWIERKGVSCFNLYRPPTIELGDANKAKPWIDLVRKVFPNDADHLIKWFAHRRQRPGEMINHGLVVGSQEQGIGKDTILEGLKRAIGAWNFQEIAPKNLFESFNPWRRSVVLRISEAKDMGDVRRDELYAAMMTLMTAPPDVLECNEKNIKQHYVFKCLGVIITTNHLTDGIYLPTEDRRHFVAWSDCKPTDFTPEFWTDYWKWFDAGGDRHVAAYLATLDLSTFDPKAPPPKTPAFWSIVNANRTSEEGELQDILDKLGRPDAVTLLEIMGAMPLEMHSLKDWLKERKNRKAVNHRLEKCGYRAVNNPVAKGDGLWRIDDRRQVVYAKVSLSVGAQEKAAETLQRKAAMAAEKIEKDRKREEEQRKRQEEKYKPRR